MTRFRHVGVVAIGLYTFSLLAQEQASSGLKLQAARPMVSQPERSPKAMVASVNPLATEAAIQIMKKGGNAVDAAVAIAFVLAVVHPEAGNMGGSGYMMVRMADGRTLVVNYGTNSPGAVKPGIFKTAQEATVGHRSITVPGTPAGMGLAHSKLGKLKWAEVLEPARKLAKDGHIASQRLELILKLEVPVMKKYPDSAKIFLHGTDQPIKQGELVIQRELGETLGRMQKKGWQEFYTGETGRLIAADVAANGGLLAAEDLKNYQAKEVEPIKLNYHGSPVLVTPPSSTGGPALAVMLNVLDQFDVKLGMEGSSAVRHLQAEAMRRGFAARQGLQAGDLTFEKMVSRQFAVDLASSIKLDKASPLPRLSTAPSGLQESPDTTHFTVADPFGNVVTNTYTLSGFFGSQVVIKGTGVLMNNHMTFFTGPKAAGNQRAGSTMTPTMLLRPDGSPWVAFGTPGALTIPSTLMQIVMNLVDFKMSLRDAVEFPRIHFAGGATGIDSEPAALVFDVAEKLRAMGHKLNPALRSQGDVNAVLLEEKDGWKQGWSDGRRGGMVKGY
ncbi:MAG: gamma-glutamyltransferase [Acidobacteria bacterium]|nr:gamma-glutamyltransferase [Acidobacteriota bacterium]